MGNDRFLPPTELLFGRTQQDWANIALKALVLRAGGELVVTAWEMEAVADLEISDHPEGFRILAIPGGRA